MISLCLVAAITTAPARHVGWWWDAPATADDPGVDALLGFVKEHPTIVSSVLMLCGPTTKSGTIAGELSPACTRVVPQLTALGVRPELWLGETDDVNAAITLVGDAPGAVAALGKLQEQLPGVLGFNFDLEVSKATMCGNERCDVRYASFLRDVRAGLAAAAAPGAPVPRVTVDVSCHKGDGWAPVISNCSLLADAADKALNMGTYNAGSYAAWLQQLQPAVEPSVDVGRLGMGLGCWNDSRTQGWSTTAESAEQRICQLMNRSLTELDMFRLKPPEWPEAFWIPQLEKFVGGGGCVPAPLPKSDCPASGWVGCGPPDCPSPACCDVSYANVNLSLCDKSVTSHETCAKQQCEASPTKCDKWIPENYSSHFYTCCPSDTPTPSPPPPAPGDCPAYGWVPCGKGDCPSADCCEESYDDVDMSKCGGATRDPNFSAQAQAAPLSRAPASEPSAAAESHEDCSKAQCEASTTRVNTWVPLNFSEHWFTCCPKSDRATKVACVAGESANRCLARARA